MTRAAIVRRQSIRAMGTLIQKWPRSYSADNFEIARKGGYDELPGTPIYWAPPDYYTGESDCRPAVEELRYLVWVEGHNWDREARRMQVEDQDNRMRSLWKRAGKGS